MSSQVIPSLHRSYGNNLMSEQPISIQVDATVKFQKKVKSLEKKHQNIRDDVRPIIEQIETGELPGNRIVGLDVEIYKVRVRNRNANRGKSGGYRLIYYVKTSDRIILVTIYSKSEQEDIDASEIEDILSEFE
jgi:mRNA-degrading endonuclease RelE of RelBE toxin-antitoxin system